jgi:tRNA(fMet)-specific endonuclease VapC
MSYLVDTNHCIYLMNAVSKSAHKRSIQEENTLQAVQVLPWPFSTFRITVAELYYGSFKSERVKQNLEALKEFKRSIKILPITEDLLKKFGQIKADLRKRGKNLENFDLMIGTTAILHDLTLVTNDAVFDHLQPALKVENWSAGGMPTS